MEEREGGRERERERERAVRYLCLFDHLSSSGVNLVDSESADHVLQDAVLAALGIHVTTIPEREGAKREGEKRKGGRDCGRERGIEGGRGE